MPPNLWKAPAGMVSFVSLVMTAGMGAFSLVPVATQSSGRTFDLLTASVADIQAAVDSGKLTYERLIELYLSRIEAYDRNGPKLNAVVALNPKAR